MRIEPFAPEDLAQNDFLGGKVKLLQPKAGYRAGVDPVLLAASVAARPGQSVLELGCGAGPALCCLNARVPGLRFAGIEVQPGYADLAQQNLALNGAEARIWVGDLTEMPAEVRQLSFDHVMANPPYFEGHKGRHAEDSGRGIGRSGETPLATWVQVAARRVKPGGTVTFIQRAERLPELLSAMREVLGSLEVLPLLPRTGRAPRLILARGRKGGQAEFRLYSGLVLHRGDSHQGDKEQYTDILSKILRDGAELTFE